MAGRYRGRVFTFADCELDPDRYELRRGGETVHVEPQVFAVLLLLVRHRDRVVRQAEMLDSVWGTRWWVDEQGRDLSELASDEPVEMSVTT